jgi:hypothetical protein
MCCISGGLAAAAREHFRIHALCLLLLLLPTVGYGAAGHAPPDKNGTAGSSTLEYRLQPSGASRYEYRTPLAAASSRRRPGSTGTTALPLAGASPSAAASAAADACPTASAAPDAADTAGPATRAFDFGFGFAAAVVAAF